MKNRILPAMALLCIFGGTLPALAATHYKAKLDKTTHLGIVASPTKVATLASKGKKAFIKCVPLKGASVEVIKSASFGGMANMMTKVKVLNGSCKGSVGWVETTKLAK
ncbi:hypothetical protein [Acidithiobacillus sp.]|jgi:hypothetical protein|uniref:hypothetical protein n=1 Tax=Acidithiobacillus sp. TaxID=1872118 RepID=UPI003563D90D